MMRRIFTIGLLLAAGCGSRANPQASPDMAVASDLAGADLQNGGGGPDGGGAPCTGQGTACTTASGGMGVCGASSTCGCMADGDCVTVYGSPGAPYVCINNACIPGSCHTSSDCPGGQLCTNNACVACSSDPQCTADPAYGNGTNGVYVCAGGACTPGNCHADSDCPVGQGQFQLCTNNKCTPCTDDQQCLNDADKTGSGGANTMCNTSSGACQSNVCGNGNNNCANPADICCAGHCSPGNCCAGGGCTGGNHCTSLNGAGVCTMCPAAIGGSYYVDPVNGHDDYGTGSSTSIMGGSCAFATITRALQVIGANPGGGTTITVIGDANTALNNTASMSPYRLAEHYPIPVLANLTITSSTAAVGGASPANIQVNVPSGATAGFNIAGNISNLSGFTINGGGAVNFGVVSSAKDDNGANSATTDHVTVKAFRRDGVVVIPGARLTVNGPAHLDGNGDANNPASGMLVLGHGIVSGANGTVSCNANQQHGLVVQGSGYVEISGNAANQTVQMVNDSVAGLFINQTPAQSLPTSTVSGVVISGIGSQSSIANANGMRVTGGSRLKLRNSIILANTKGSGVVVVPFVATGGNNNDVSAIDLGGGDGVNGGNTLQASAGIGSSPNRDTGICLAIAPNQSGATGTLNAKGNLFEGVDCSQTAGTLKSNSTCSGGVDKSVLTRPGTTNSNKIDTTMCP